MSFNISIIEDSLIYTTTLASIFYIFFKLLMIKIDKNIKKLFLFISSAFIVFFSLLIRQYNYTLSRVVFITILFVIMKVIGKISINTIPSYIISISLVYFFQIISLVLFSCVFSIFGYSDINIFCIVLINIGTFSLSLIFSKNKRLNKFLLYFNNKKNLGGGLILSGLLITFILIVSNKSIISKSFALALLIGAIISGIGLFLWIRKSITEHYRKKLQAKADEHYQNTLLEKEQQIEQLNNSNAFLSKIVHRDNHIMTSLQHTITKYKDCDNPIEREKLMNEILTLAQERSDLIVKEQANTKVLPTTGISLIDGALSNMYIKATAHHIDFNLIISQDIHYLINNLITQTDLETLLCDHIKDAIIAINSGEVIKGKILVTITMNDDIYEISIKDNGVDFEVDTLAKLGLERVTTHKDIGGSGIGFMTTFETLKRSNASIIITEHKTKTPFSKSITFRFDGLNAFIINSYRADLLKQSINRNDIIIM